MSEERPEENVNEPGGDEAPAPTPFDNPYFLPIILWGFAAWFGWDIVTDAEAYQEWPWFNRIGLVVSGGAAFWFTRSAILEKREEDES